MMSESQIEEVAKREIEEILHNLMVVTDLTEVEVDIIKAMVAREWRCEMCRNSLTDKKTGELSCKFTHASGPDPCISWRRCEDI